MNEFDKLCEAILLFCDGLDAVTAQLRKSLNAETVAFKTADKSKEEARLFFASHGDLTKPAYDVTKIVWADAEGAKGPFLLAKEEGQMSDENKQQFTLLREALKTAGKSIFGKSEMIWLFQNDEKAIGRKKRETV